jgi:hypothetical protein
MRQTNFITSVTSKNLPKDAFEILYEEASRESAEYIRQYIDTCIIADGGWWDVAIKKIKIPGLCLEFGVYKGESINFFSKRCPDKIWYGFDSFEGFQEDWLGGYFGKNQFTLEGKLPSVNKNVILVKGWFKDTLPNFLLENNTNVSFVHIDCDTYESTIEILEMLGPKRFVQNSRILFDEYISYIGWKNNEFKAWREFTKKYNVKYKYEMFGSRQALIKIL